MLDVQKTLYAKEYGNSVGSTRGYGGYRNALRIKKFIKLIDPQPEDKILEIGCNRGLLLTNIQILAPKSIGVDVNKELVATINNPSITYMSATDLKLPMNSFNKVCAFEVIEHIDDIAKVFSEVYKILKRGGEFIISFPVEIIRGQTALLDAWTVYKDLRFARKLHIHKLTPNKIKKMAEPLGYEVIESKIMLIPFPSFVMKLKK